MYRDGAVRHLESYASGPYDDLAVYASSRYGYEGSVANAYGTESYWNEEAGTFVTDPPKLNPILGQYELWTPQLYVARVAKVPERLGMAIAPHGAMLLSAALPDGRTRNYHSDAVNEQLDYLIDEDLSGKTVLPVQAR